MGDRGWGFTTRDLADFPYLVLFILHPSYFSLYLGRV
jgi:hypothetical protein